MNILTLCGVAKSQGACPGGLSWAQSLDPEDTPPPATDAEGVKAWLAWAKARLARRDHRNAACKAAKGR